MAADAIPDLVRLGLADRNVFVRWASARTLGELAPRRTALVVPKLADALTDEDLDARLAAATALRRFGEDAAPAVPALARMLSKGDVESRVAMIQTLTAIGPAASASLPMMAQQLTHPDARVRIAAAQGLGAYGKTSVNFVPDLIAKLRVLLNDTDGDVRSAAGEAILYIDGK